MTLRVVPCTITEARAFVERHHAHHHAPVGGLFAVAVADGGRVSCVAIMSRPVARLLDAQGHVAELTRSASDRTEHAASKCIAAAARMALAGGYTRLVSYTLLGETGVAYLAAGWHVTGLSGGGDGWNSRAGRAVSQTAEKIRWETGPDALPYDEAADLYRATAVGVVPINPRTETLPLLAEVSP